MVIGGLGGNWGLWVVIRGAMGGKWGGVMAAERGVEGVN